MNYRPEPIEQSDRNYFVAHWHGEHPLRQAFWINYVILGNVIGSLLVYTVSHYGADIPSIQFAALSTVFALALSTIIFVWGAVGVWRSANEQEEGGGDSSWAGLAKTLILLGAVSTAGQVYNYSATLWETMQLSVGSDPLGDAAQLTIDGTTIFIDGPLALGTAANFQDLLENNPQITSVNIRSIGGRTFEGEQIADAIRERSLNVVAREECSSACTLVLLSGQLRSTEMGTGIGFHQPSFPGLSDLELRMEFQQLRDAYREAGLSAPFVRTALQTDAEDMWYPDESVLFREGVLNHMTEQRLSDEAYAYAEAVRSELPIQLDEVTTATDIRSEQSSIIINHALQLNRSEIDRENLVSFVYDNMKNELCKDSIIPLYISNGIEFLYDYYDSEGNQVASVKLSEC